MHINNDNVGDFLTQSKSCLKPVIRCSIDFIITQNNWQFNTDNEDNKDSSFGRSRLSLNSQSILTLSSEDFWKQQWMSCADQVIWSDSYSMCTAVCYSSIEGQVESHSMVLICAIINSRWKELLVSDFHFSFCFPCPFYLVWLCLTLSDCSLRCHSLVVSIHNRNKPVLQ